MFASIGGHVIPCIHCLLTGKQETIYTEVLRKIRELVPQLQPIRGMSDWEKAPRNSLKIVFERIDLQGCLFHYAQNIWRKLQKLGIANLYHSNKEFRKLVRALMNLPFLPEESIGVDRPGHTRVDIPRLNHVLGRIIFILIKCILNKHNT